MPDARQKPDREGGCLTWDNWQLKTDAGHGNRNFSSPGVVIHAWQGSFPSCVAGLSGRTNRFGEASGGSCTEFGAQ